MGMYDEVRVPCPHCRTVEMFQSKGGSCEMRRYELIVAPEDVLSNVNRHAPYQCTTCGTWFAVNEQARRSIIADPPPDHAAYLINGWYVRKGHRSEEQQT